MDLVRVERTFHKVLPTNRYKKRAESRRQPAPSAPLQLLDRPEDGRQFADHRPARRRRRHHHQRTLPDTPRQHITHDRTRKTATIQPSPIITRPQPATSTSVSPPKKKTRTQSPSAPASIKKNRSRYDGYDFSYPLHEKYGLQEVFNVKMMNSDDANKAQRLQSPDETINIEKASCFLLSSCTSSTSATGNGPWLILLVPNFRRHWSSAYSF